MATKPEWEKCLAEIVESNAADVLLCNAALERDIDEKIINLCHRRRRRPNIVLVLITEGGSPDVAYRIARTLQSLYKQFYCIISGYCKSAGTLLALGAHELIFGPYGELGPLDIQMAKKDELMESESGLTVMTALTALHEKALLAFEHFFLQTTVHGGGRISVRTASQIATELTKALFSPISDQIDPLHVGEAWRSMTIAKAYGERLATASKNFSADKLDELISEYPSHGFVIDRIEAGKIFNHVRETNAAEQGLLDAWAGAVINPTKNPIIKFLTEELREEQSDANTQTTGAEQYNLRSAPQTGTNVQAERQAGAAAGE